MGKDFTTVWFIYHLGTTTPSIHQPSGKSDFGGIFQVSFGNLVTEDVLERLNVHWHLLSVSFYVATQQKQQAFHFFLHFVNCALPIYGFQFYLFQISILNTVTDIVAIVTKISLAVAKL